MNADSAAPSGTLSEPRRLLLLMGAILALLLWTAGRTSLWNIDEGRISEVAREMWLTGDWLTPRIAGQAFPAYPPLAYWLMALSGGLFGFTEFSMRLPSILAAIGLLGAVASVARRSAGVGFHAALVLSSLPVFFLQSSMCRADILTSSLSVAAFDRFHAWAQGKRRGIDLAAMYGFTALGILAKGPIAVAMLGLAGLAWFCSTGRWRLLREMKFELGIPAVLLLVVPWYLLVHRANPTDFLQRNLLMENANAFTHGNEHGRPFAFYLSRLLLPTLPWVLALLLLPRFRRHPGVSFAALWFLFTLLFLSIAGSKRPSYLAYLCAPLALSVGLTLDAGLRESPRLVRRGLLGLGGLLVLAAAVLGSLPRSLWTGGRVVQIAPDFPVLAALLALAAITMAAVTLRNGPRAGLWCLAAVMGLGFAGYALLVAPRLDGVGRAGMAFCGRVAAATPPGEAVWTLAGPTEPEGAIHFYSPAPLTIHSGEAGLYILPPSQVQALRGEGRRVELLDAYEDERGRRVSFARVYP